MALLERGLKQRIVGALVLIALAVIFLPMLFTREDESRQVVVEAPPRPPPAEKRLDANNLPQSWSVQLASLSNRARAEELQKTLRSQGYNAYIRSFDGMNRVFVGPVIQRAEADRLRDQLSKQQKLNGFVVRFQPERG
ncbi:SPOR domain-containing protein [Pseudomonas aeruginosa]|uniref:SPOR domain-containing protein n=1 Tax=Pseudomonas aeruginosa TaxID=287 RepID=UPI001C1DD7D8|nr:SPOR domain-containing protein [Pseudomonas aeruginosa]MBU5916695.1 SPOR domain-containing protein [Pseudomonas aeruginosa]